jgi:hypothetical protein
MIGVPLLVTLATRTRLIDKNTFVNSEGKIITEQQMPYSFIWASIAGFGFLVLLDMKIGFLPYFDNFLAYFLGNFMMLAGFSLYFIFKNCPVSILFNFKFWNLKMSQNMQSTYHNSSFLNSYNDLSNSHLPTNVHHKRKH